MYSAGEGSDLCDVCPDCVACKGRAVEMPCDNPSGCPKVPIPDKPRGVASTHGTSLLLVTILELFFMLHLAFAF